jgi:circadian clock protein KaiB
MDRPGEIVEHPKLAKENNLVALPTVIRTRPAPIRKFVGDSSDGDGKLVGFDVISGDKR